MSNIRSWCVLLGIAGVIATGVVVAHPTVGAVLPIDGIWMDYLVVAALGLVTFVLAGILLSVRSFGGVRETHPDVVETPHDRPPGDIVAASLSDLPTLRATDSHRLFHAQLRELTVSAIVQRHHCSRSAAEERVRDGTWTDNPLAANFLQSSEFVPPPLHTRCRELLTGQRWYRDRVVATVRSLEQLEGIAD